MVINSKEHLKLFCDGLSGEYQELFQDRTDWYERVMVNYDDYDDLEEDDVFPQEEKYEMLGRIMQEINYGQFLPHFCHDFPEFIKKSKVRNKPKEHGTSKSIEGKTFSGMRVIMIDDVVTTGGSVLNGIKQLKDMGLTISDVYVVVNRLGGAKKAFDSVGVTLHQLTDIIEITKVLYQEKLVTDEILEKIKNQIN